MMGSSKTVSEAKKVVEGIRQTLNAFKPDIKMASHTIDWGRARGQGKRIGSMVVGAMSNAPTGLKTYHSVDLGEWAEEANGDFRYFNQNNMYRYAAARKYGCNHIEARYYAVKYDENGR